MIVKYNVEKYNPLHGFASAVPCTMLALLLQPACLHSRQAPCQSPWGKCEATDDPKPRRNVPFKLSPGVGETRAHPGFPLKLPLGTPGCVEAVLWGIPGCASSVPVGTRGCTAHMDVMAQSNSDFENQ